MKVRTLIYNAVRSIVVGSLFQLVYYYTYMKGKGIECSFEDHVLGALKWICVFFVFDIVCELIHSRKEKKKNEENNDKITQ